MQGQLASAVEAVHAKVKVISQALLFQSHPHPTLQVAIGTDRAVALSLSDPPLGSRHASTLNKATTSVIMCVSSAALLHLPPPCLLFIANEALRLYTADV